MALKTPCGWQSPGRHFAPRGAARHLGERTPRDAGPVTRGRRRCGLGPGGGRVRGPPSGLASVPAAPARREEAPSPRPSAGSAPAGPSFTCSAPARPRRSKSEAAMAQTPQAEVAGGNVSPAALRRPRTRPRGRAGQSQARRGGARAEDLRALPHSPPGFPRLPEATPQRRHHQSQARSPGGPPPAGADLGGVGPAALQGGQRRARV
jgi:hypothetical protein